MLLFPLAPILPAPLRFSEGEIPGRYYLGDGRGLNLNLDVRADGRYDRLHTGCLGVYGRSSGTWTLRGDAMTFRPREWSSEAGRREMRLIPVKWGRRITLVEEDAMPGFAVAARRPIEGPGAMPEFAQTEYAKLDVDTGTLPRSGRPVLPLRYAGFLARGPITAGVTRIDGEWVTLDRGRTSGLWPGLHLTVSHGTPSYGGPEVEIVAISAREARARVIAGRGATAGAGTIEVGMRFTTGED